MYCGYTVHARIRQTATFFWGSKAQPMFLASVTMNTECIKLLLHTWHKSWEAKYIFAVLMSVMPNLMCYKKQAQSYIKYVKYCTLSKYTMILVK